jgi:hypothetical protein
MTMEYAVKGETHEGNTLTLRRGFMSQEAAEDHPVQMSLWKRIWVEPVGEIAEKKPPTLPPMPWDWVCADFPTNNARAHIYLVDATGRKIAAIWGKDGEKELTADFILNAVTAYNVCGAPLEPALLAAALASIKPETAG